MKRKEKAKKEVKYSQMDNEELNELLSIRTVDVEEVQILDQKPAERKGRFQPYMIEEVRMLAAFGLTNAEIADFYKISNQTLVNYCQLYPELDEALMEGRVNSGLKYLTSLNKIAMGYMVEETEEEDRPTKFGMVTVKKKTTRHIPPDFRALQYLMRCRFPDRWNEVNKSESTQRVEIAIAKMDLSNLSTEELALMKKLSLGSNPTAK